MELKSIIGRMVPLIIGILIGAGLTKNRNVMYLIMGYVIFMILFTLFSNKIKNIKSSTDKKLATRNAVVESLNDAIDTTEKGHLLGESIFDKYYPKLVFYWNLLMLTGTIWLIYKKNYPIALILFISMNFFIVINQIWRKVKYLDTKEYDEHIKDKIFQKKLEKTQEKELRKFGVQKIGNP